MFQYYIKIVPTTFARVDGSTFVTNQFSVTRHSKVSQIWTTPFTGSKKELLIIVPEH
jgi:hypothetical protein